MVYAVVRAGGRQEKVEVGTIVTMDRIKADKDGNVELVPVLLVDGDKITSDAKALAKVKVTAEVLERPPRPEDRHPEVQEQDRVQEAPGPPSGAHARQDHRHQVAAARKENRHGTQKGRELHPQRS